jgi:hypothetical protein
LGVVLGLFFDSLPFAGTWSDLCEEEGSFHGRIMNARYGTTEMCRVFFTKFQVSGGGSGRIWSGPQILDRTSRVSLIAQLHGMGDCTANAPILFLLDDLNFNRWNLMQDYDNLDGSA